MCRDAQCSAGRNCGAHIKTETYQMNNGQSTPHRFFLQGVPYHYQMKLFCHFCTLEDNQKNNAFLKGEIFSNCNQISWADVILWALRAVQLVGPHGEQNEECDRTKGAPLPTSLGPASARDGSEWNLVWKGLLCKGVHTFFCSTKYCRQKPVI